MERNTWHLSSDHLCWPEVSCGQLKSSLEDFCPELSGGLPQPFPRWLSPILSAATVLGRGQESDEDLGVGEQ